MTSLAAELARVGLTSLREVRRVTVTEPGDGLAEADRLVDGGADLVVVEAAASSAATAVIALLLDLEPVAAVGTAGGPGWAEQVVAVREGLRRTRPLRGDLPGLLAELADPVLTRLTGLLGGLAERRTPVLLADTSTVMAAGLLASREHPGAEAWWLASAVPADPAGRAARQALGLAPLLDLDLAGDAARYAVALLREAVGDA